MILLNFLMYKLYLVHPLVKVEDQIVATSVGSNVTLSCVVESSPKSVNMWMRKMEPSIRGPFGREGGEPTRECNFEVERKLLRKLSLSFLLPSITKRSYPDVGRIIFLVICYLICFKKVQILKNL